MNYYKDLLKNLDKTLLILPLIFAVISVIMIGSTAYSDSFSFTRGMKIQIAAFIMGMAAIVIILLFDYLILEQLDKIIYVISILFLFTVFIPGIGLEQYGARGWIDLGPMNFQPAEIVKISFTVCYASYLTRNQGNLHTLKGLVIAGIYVFPFIAIIAVLQNDLGNALVIAVIAAIMLFAAGVDGKLYAKVATIAVLSIPIIYRFMAEHQKQRIDAFLHPDNLLLPGNYQVWQSKVAIGSGGILGKGLFEGTQKELKFLPVQDSDFIFSVIVEEWGFVGGVIIIALYLLFLYRIIKIAKNAKDTFGSLIVIGILGMFFFQIFQNIGMTMGLMPVTGITLPFISAGGSSVLTNMIALGIVLNVCIRSKVINF
ncbi:MAG: rod shape-determining protein RodA [Clostridiales bacterium]|jgi:rod shape determining protein RodA|nr:rod shape-determining protein RodA [Clostridiales bacterium]